MKKQIFIGIDVSAETLDLCIKTGEQSQSTVIKNKTGDITKFLKPYADTDAVIAMENTGRYNWQLYEVLAKFKFLVYVIPALHLKRSMGLIRGKNDKVDAIRIANFIIKNHRELARWECPSPSIQKLKVLITERNHRIKTKRQLLKMQHDYKLMKSMGLDKTLSKMNKASIEHLNDQIEALEKQIESLIRCDEALSNQAKLIRSVPGVGKVLSWSLLAKTNGFKTIATARKLACYGGVVPFDHQSGSSLYKRPKVSPLADKSFKSLLHMAAMSAIRLNNDLRRYYVRKVNEGKNKMSVLNAVRNKIIHRVYAVIKSQNPYQPNLVLS